MSSLRFALRLAFTRQALLQSATPRVAPQLTPSVVGFYQLRRYSSKKEESDEEFDARWEAYFNRDDIDAWELRKGLNDLYGYDVVPQPKIVVAMLKAARRLNDVALAVRILESVKEKAAGDQKVYSFVMEGVKPTLEELGLETPEKLGIA